VPEHHGDVPHDHADQCDHRELVDDQHDGRELGHRRDEWRDAERVE